MRNVTLKSVIAITVELEKKCVNTTSEFVNLMLCFSLQNEHHQKRAAPKAPTHNELRTRRPMW